MNLPNKVGISDAEPGFYVSVMMEALPPSLEFDKNAVCAGLLLARRVPKDHIIGHLLDGLFGALFELEGLAKHYQAGRQDAVRRRIRYMALQLRDSIHEGWEKLGEEVVR